MLPEISFEQEASLVQRARSGDDGAVTELVEPLRRPLFAYIYRMVTHRADAEDLLQDVLVRVLQSLQSYRGGARFKTWVFGIATHVCLDHLRNKKRWRVEAQLEGEREAHANPERIDRLGALMSHPDFVFEIREHIAFCFSCIGRTLPPEEQAAIMLREVLGFSNQEAAAILELSEPVFRHRLSAARSTMIDSYAGLCQLINKTGVCWQCRGLRELAPEAHRGPDLIQIEVAPGLSVTPENLFDARLAIVRDADLEEGSTRALHGLFYERTTLREESK
ncbi:MAG TPA: RNA polymerase sigma factor [Blastocatellia bacterium]|nr:RNA polymerase sigma factor [Blastocatellia bacterium]